MGEYSDIMGDFTAADVTPGDADTVDTTDFNIPDVASAGSAPDDEALTDAANAGSLFPEEGSGVAGDFGTLGFPTSIPAGLFGPGGSIIDTGGGSRAAGGSAAGTSRQLVPVRGGLSGDTRLRTILLAAAARLGKHIALKGIVHLIKKWGLPAAAGAFGLGADDLLYILARYEVRPRRGARGPHLRTVVRRIRQGHHYEHMLAKYAAKAHIRRHSYAPMYRRRRSRRRRR